MLGFYIMKSKRHLHFRHQEFGINAHVSNNSLICKASALTFRQDFKIHNQVFMYEPGFLATLALSQLL